MVDDQLKHPSDAPTIGLILCQRSNQGLADYALRGPDKPIGVSTFELTRALPASLQLALPSIDAIEAERSERVGPRRRVTPQPLAEQLPGLVQASIEPTSVG